MIPIVTPQQMAAVDAAAPEPSEVLIERAGAVVARTALQMMSGRYGKRVLVLAGTGNNGADGRAAARRLRNVGVRVRLVEASSAPEVLEPADLYIDAALGTGLSRPWQAPRRASADAGVLAVDIPSGLDGLNGNTNVGSVWRADRTVTFAALKPGLLLGDGPALCGEVTVADIGLSVESTFDDAPRCHLITDDDVEPLPTGSNVTHKWHAGLLVVAGSPGMEGAAFLTCMAGLRSGARIVHLHAAAEVVAPVEVVRTLAPVKEIQQRFKACAVGPGLGLGHAATARLRDALSLNLPTVVDADALRLLRQPLLRQVLQERKKLSIPTILTPHAGECRSLLSTKNDGCSIADKGRDSSNEGRGIAAEGRDSSNEGRGIAAEGCDTGSDGRDTGKEGCDFGDEGRYASSEVSGIAAEGRYASSEVSGIAAEGRYASSEVSGIADGRAEANNAADRLITDPITVAREIASEFQAVTLLKGGPTVIADPDGNTIIVSSGDARLATAGSGDVLTGIIAGRMATFGDDPLRRTAEAAHIHARAAIAIPGCRIVASDLVDALPKVTS